MASTTTSTTPQSPRGLGRLPLGGVPLGRFRTRRGGSGVDSAWQRHVGFATGANPHRCWPVSRGAIPYRETSIASPAAGPTHLLASSPALRAVG